MKHALHSRSRPMARPLSLAFFLALSGSLLVAPSVHASSPTEKVFCTHAPRSQWMSEAQAREIFGAAHYVVVKFKISRGNCHEFYAVDAQGGVVEAYLHPVTGQEIRATRFPAPSTRPNHR